MWSLFRSRTVNALAQAVESIEQQYQFTPYNLSAHIPYRTFGMKSGVIGGKLMSHSQTTVGHLAVEVEKNTLNIYGFGRHGGAGSPNGEMTTVIRSVIDAVTEAGVNHIVLRDFSNGYWPHIAAKYYPHLRWTLN